MSRTQDRDRTTLRIFSAVIAFAVLLGLVGSVSLALAAVGWWRVSALVGWSVIGTGAAVIAVRLRSRP